MGVEGEEEEGDEVVLDGGPRESKLRDCLHGDALFERWS